MMNSACELHPLLLEEPHLSAMARIYAEVFTLDWNAEYPGFLSYVQRFPDFRGLVANVGQEIVGVGWGTRSQPGEWLYNCVSDQIGNDHPVLRDTWVLCILAVLEPFRGRGIGSRLHDALLNDQPCSNALVSTAVDNTNARRLYELWGWTYFEPECIVQAGGRQLVVLHKECRKA